MSNKAEIVDINTRARLRGIADPMNSIEVANVTVAYRSYRERPSTLKEQILRFVKQGTLKHYSTFNALTDVSISIKRGKVFGVIGSNGSGKSTLLKVISKVLKPTNGTVAIDGKVASLIELGAGFDPELNAIENIYLHCSLHGKSRKEIKERVPHIIEFAELKDFATTPIKYYSSGMYARLGFSVAVDIDPDVLLVDEILGVGDERFQKKCHKVFHDFINAGKTIVLVTHALDDLEHLTNEVVLLSKGKVVFQGTPSDALRIYK